MGRAIGQAAVSDGTTLWFVDNILTLQSHSVCICSGDTVQGIAAKTYRLGSGIFQAQSQTVRRSGLFNATAINTARAYTSPSAIPAIAVQIYNLSGVSQGSISLTGGTWAGLAVSESLVYALDNAANSVEIVNLSGVSQGSITLGAGDWTGLAVTGSLL